MFFTLYEMRQNRESERRWQARFDQIQKDRQAAREEHQAWMAEHRARREEHRAWMAKCQARLAKYLARQEEHRVGEEECQVGPEELQQQIITLLAQNQQLMLRLIELLERRSDSAAGASD